LHRQSTNFFARSSGRKGRFSGARNPESLSVGPILTSKEMTGLHVVDLSAVSPAELEGLWQREAQLWRERLLWNVSDRLAALGRVMQRGDLSGKAVRVGGRIVGYAYYVLGGHLGVIADLVASPESSTAATAILMQETVDEIRRTGVSRIESSFVAIDGPSLPPLFEREGFRTSWREFMRCELRGKQQPVSPPALVQLKPLRGSDLGEAAAIMQAAYSGGVDAEMGQLYRTYEGCELVLQDLLNHSGGGIPLEASAIARHRGRGIGFIILTEIAARQGHLPQVAVLPEYQRRGLGRQLVNYGLSRLAELGFDTLSLIVSRLNRPALRMYQVIGFRPVLSFPVFTWER
jgi:ribosomal protein S18 acetylase RimI-like enzyme